MVNDMVNILFSMVNNMVNILLVMVNILLVGVSAPFFRFPRAPDFKGLPLLEMMEKWCTPETAVANCSPLVKLIQSVRKRVHMCKYLGLRFTMRSTYHMSDLSLIEFN